MTLLLLALGVLMNAIALILVQRRVSRLMKYRPNAVGMAAERNFVRIRKAAQDIAKLQVGVTPTHVALAVVKKVAQDLSEIE